MTIDLRVPKIVKFASGSKWYQWARPDANMIDRDNTGLRQPIPIAPRLPAESFAGGTAPRSSLLLTWRTNRQCSTCISLYGPELGGGGHCPARAPSNQSGRSCCWCNPLKVTSPLSQLKKALPQRFLFGPCGFFHPDDGQLSWMGFRACGLFGKTSVLRMSGSWVLRNRQGCISMRVPAWSRTGRARMRSSCEFSTGVS